MGNGKAVTKPLTKDELIKVIAQESHVRREVVALVLEKFADIAIEEIVNKGTFRLDNVFTVTEHEVKNLRVPRSRYTTGGVIPTSTRLSTKLSTTIRELYKLQKEFPATPGLVNRDSWKDALKWREEGHHGPAKKTFQTPEKPQKTVELHNPFLDEDD